jgi:type II secretory pathway component PulF
MPTFEYHAIRAEGRTEGNEEKSFVGGVVVAKSRHEAKQKLRELGLKATMLTKARGVMALLKWLEADIR